MLHGVQSIRTHIDEMQMTEFFVDLCKPFMAGSVFPMITFIIVGLLAFMIANAWGVCTQDKLFEAQENIISMLGTADYLVDAVKMRFGLE